MGKTYYPQQDWTPPPTLTVREMIKLLMELPPDASVIIKSPDYGSFGPKQYYAVEGVDKVTLPRKEQRNEAGWECDEETGLPKFRELDIQVWQEWNGVVIR